MPKLDYYMSDLLRRLYLEIADDGLNPGPLLLAASEKMYTFDQILFSIAGLIYACESEPPPTHADMGAMILWALIECTKGEHEQ